MGTRKKGSELVFNLQWRNKQDNGGDKSNVIGMYDTPTTTSNFEMFKSYLLKNSGVVCNDVKITYLTDNGQEWVIDSQEWFEIALSSFRLKARLGEVIFLKLDKIPDGRRSMLRKHSNDVETQSDVDSLSNTVVTPPEWFVAYMKQFKRDVVEEVTYAIASSLPTNTKEKENAPIVVTTVKKAKPEPSKRSRKHLVLGESHIDKELLKTLKFDRKLETKLDKLDAKTKKIKEKKQALISKLENDERFLNKMSVIPPDDCESNISESALGKPLWEVIDRTGEDKMVFLNDDHGIPLLHGNATNARCFEHMMGGEIYLHTWEIVNDGKIQWDANTELRLTWGSADLIPNIKSYRCPFLIPGEKAKFSVRFEVPTKPGTYENYWNYYQGDLRFGHSLSVVILVEQPLRLIPEDIIKFPLPKADVPDVIEKRLVSKEEKKSPKETKKEESKPVETSEETASAAETKKEESKPVETSEETASAVDPVSKETTSVQNADVKTTDEKPVVYAETQYEWKPLFEDPEPNFSILRLLDTPMIRPACYNSYYAQLGQEPKVSRVKHRVPRYPLQTPKKIPTEKPDITKNSQENIKPPEDKFARVFYQWVNNQDFPKNETSVNIESPCKLAESNNGNTEEPVQKHFIDVDDLCVLQTVEFPKETETENTVMDLSRRIEDIKIAGPSNADSDSDWESVWSYEKAKNGDENLTTDSANRSSNKYGIQEKDLLVDLSACSKDAKEEKTENKNDETDENKVDANRNEDKNNNNGMVENNNSGDSISEIASDVSSDVSSGYDVLQVPVCEEKEESSGYVYITIDGNKLPVPKHILRPDFVATAEEAPGPLISDDEKQEKQVASQENVPQEALTKDAEVLVESKLNIPEESKDNSDVTHGSLYAAPCRLFIFPQNNPGYEVVSNSTTSFVSKEEPIDSTQTYTWSNSFTQYSFPDGENPNGISTTHLKSDPYGPLEQSESSYGDHRSTPVPSCQRSHSDFCYNMSPPPAHNSCPFANYGPNHYKMWCPQYPHVSNYQQGGPQPCHGPSQMEDTPSAPPPPPKTPEQSPGHAVPVHILPENLVNGAVNVASSAINTARSVINMIVPPKTEPGRWVNGHWVTENPESLRAKNLVILAEMGFWDADLNATLLARYNDDITRVVSELIQ